MAWVLPLSRLNNYNKDYYYATTSEAVIKAISIFFDNVNQPENASYKESDTAIGNEGDEGDKGDVESTENTADYCNVAGWQLRKKTK